MQRVRDEINGMVLEAIGPDKSEVLEGLLVEMLAVIEDSEASALGAREEAT
jgi:hypothetical protein